MTGPAQDEQRGGSRALGRSTIVAYGGWAVLSLMLVIGTLTTLGQAERTGRDAVLDRADEGAAELQETALRAFEQVGLLQRLAQTRFSFMEAGNVQGTGAIEQQIRSLLAQDHFGITQVSIVRLDGARDVLAGGGAGQPGPVAATALPDAGAIAIAPPTHDAQQAGRWSFEARRILLNGAGQPEAAAVVSLDPLTLSAQIAGQVLHAGERSLIQLRDGGAILASSRAPVSALTERVSPNDPIVLAGRAAPGGKFRDRVPGIDRLVGFRAPADVPIVVSRSLDTDTALADFYRLKRIVLTVILALIVGALVATRLVLANFLLQERLSEQALTDPLTGLRNRRYFSDVLNRRMASALRQGETALVLLIDLDGFKQVNDTRGHPAGDELLRQVADRLRDCASASDVVMRFGGDEFAIVRIGRPQRRDATSLARLIVNALAEPYDVEDYRLRISVSVGVAMPPDAGEDLNDMLRRADIALYFVKAEGGSAYQLFEPAMENSVRTRRALELDLREAEARGELEVYFQPLVHLEPRRVNGFEALLRWHHPTLGMVMPSKFIPLAEETGLIASMGEWVLRRSCLEAARWPGQTRVAVNLSPIQFERSDIVDIVASALRESRLEPSRLELEITEGVVMRDTGDALAIMRQLQALGVRLALDDFGTGYSSLSYLRSFPFDKVKVDGSFLADMKGDGGTIIRAVLGLCAHLGLDSLVEGVETEEQLEWLRMEGCTEVQGHVFSPPAPASRAPEIIGSVAGRVIRTEPSEAAPA